MKHWFDCLKLLLTSSLTLRLALWWTVNSFCILILIFVRAPRKHSRSRQLLFTLYSKICLRHRFNSKDDNYGLKLNAAVGFLGVSDRDQSAVWDQCSKTCFALSRMSYNFGNILAQNLFGCTYLLQICIVNMKRFSAT